MSEKPFAEEYPNLTSLGRGAVRWLAGIGTALILTGVLGMMNVSDFLTGWIACSGFALVSGAFGDNA